MNDTDRAGLRKPWGPGQSGNPRGRPRGARSILSEQFISALQRDFEENGVSVIERVRTQSPEDYLKLIARVVPVHVDATATFTTDADALREQMMRKLCAFADEGDEADDEMPVAGNA